MTAKSGVRIQPADDIGGHFNDQRDGSIKMTRTTIANFAGALEFRLRQPVVDETHLSGVYTLTLAYAPDRDVNSRPDETAPSIFSALEEQLGLKLEPRKLPVDVLVVDHCEKTPTEN